MRTQAEWKVETHIFSATGPDQRAPTRCFISSAALLVKVMARISNGETPSSLDEVGDAVGEHPGLARAGPGHHQQRPLAVGDRLELGRVEALEQVGMVVAGMVVAGMVVAGLVVPGLVEGAREQLGRHAAGGSRHDAPTLQVGV